ncbi:hypothetical protein [Nostoc sp. FACHB-145]|nr:hypothetical protein [Nostoc sp. FACHB-145]
MNAIAPPEYTGIAQTQNVVGWTILCRAIALSNMTITASTVIIL